MAYLIADNREAAQETRSYSVTKATKQAATVVADKTEDSVHFIFVWTAVFWYYFFSGLYFLIWRRLPKGWKRLRKEEVALVIGNVSDYLPQKRQQKKYGRVVDLDTPKSTVELLHPDLWRGFCSALRFLAGVGSSNAAVSSELLSFLAAPTSVLRIAALAIGQPSSPLVVGNTKNVMCVFGKVVGVGDFSGDLASAFRTFD